MKRYLIFLLSVAIFSLNFSLAEEEKDPMNSGTFSGLKFRSIGPALNAGRIIDFAVNPCNHDEFYVAVASGGVWKTTNHGTTFNPVFDSQGSYSIGCVTLDPNNSHVVWVGSGENNSQRSVAYGDGVYKSCDGGKTWKNVGLENSEHIGKIIVHPENSNVVYVAAQGPLWKAGGDRGLYKTTDGGKTWEISLEISENTGVSDIVMDPRDPDVMYCSSYQRRRHVWTLINGGPESAVYKTTDGGENWNKLGGGLPSGYVGRIGLAISPVNPDYVYALVEASEDNGGFFRSTDRGASWSKQGNYKTVSAQYYQEIFCDPVVLDKIYSVDTYSKVTYDGGKTWENLGLKHRHVDDHALWIDPTNNKHLLIGGDGGVYETFDEGSTWRFFENMPITQYYRITVDNSEPFYFVYGGTQDNNTYGGPSATTSADGITNEDWFKVVGGDGFKPQVDPENPNIVYAQPQYGVLIRYDRRSGEVVLIQPQAEKDETLIWNWNSPLLISPHSNTRLYFAANKLFRSDDRGQSWKKISGDLTRQIDRNKLPVMDRIWEPEAVAKNASTSIYGNIVSLSESPVKEDLIYVGTDDGLIQVTENAGENWYKVDRVANVPETTYVSDLKASLHDENVVFAAFDNRKKGDFKPYVFKSNDKGRSWKSITGDLPEKGTVYSIVQDHINPDLLFAGTEFGAYFTLDGGDKWIKLSAGIPTIAVRDMEIQKRENDLATATFGRSFYILDNYAPLREVTPELLEKDAHIFKIKDALMYNQDDSRTKGHMGETFFRADNRTFGAVFTYYLKESLKTKKQERQTKEAEERKKEKDQTGIKNANYDYPTWKQLRAEDLEEDPYLLLTIADDKGTVIRRLKAPASKGIHRIAWDLTYPSPFPIDEDTNPDKHNGFKVLPGTYQLTLAQVVDGQVTALAGPELFECKLLQNATLPAANRSDIVEFQREVGELVKVVYGAQGYLHEMHKELQAMKNAAYATEGMPVFVFEKIRKIEYDMEDIDKALNGDQSIASRNGPQPPSITGRLQNILWSIWENSSEPSETNREQYEIITEDFSPVYAKIKALNDTDMKEIRELLDKYNAPITPGRFPEWNK